MKGLCVSEACCSFAFRFHFSDGDCTKSQGMSKRPAFGNNTEEEKSACEVSDLLYLAGNVASFR